MYGSFAFKTIFKAIVIKLENGIALKILVLGGYFNVCF